MTREQIMAKALYEIECLLDEKLDDQHDSVTADKIWKILQEQPLHSIVWRQAVSLGWIRTIRRAR